MRPCQFNQQINDAAWSVVHVCFKEDAGRADILCDASASIQPHWPRRVHPVFSPLIHSSCDFASDFPFFRPFFFQTAPPYDDAIIRAAAHIPWNKHRWLAETLKRIWNDIGTRALLAAGGSIWLLRGI